MSSQPSAKGRAVIRVTEWFQVVNSKLESEEVNRDESLQRTSPAEPHYSSNPQTSSVQDELALRVNDDDDDDDAYDCPRVSPFYAASCIMYHDSTKKKAGICT